MEAHEIRIIEYDFKNDCKRLLSQILENRLKQDCPFTWHDIVAGLRSDAVEEYALADELSF